MELKEIDSLVELFFKKLESKSSEEKKELFLVSLKNRNFKDTLSGPYTYSWKDIETKIFFLSNYLKKIISQDDRCVLLSENRPEWLISDIAIMNAGGVTVPLYTTYSENDYKYIIGDCKPKVCIVSNNEQFKKIKDYIKEETILISIDLLDEYVVCFNKIFNLFKFIII